MDPVRRRRRRRSATRAAETPHSTHRSLINQPVNPRSRRCPFPCRHSPLFASNGPVSVARERTESPLPADDPHDSLLPPFVTRVARDNPPSPAPAPPQPRASSPIGYPIRLPRSRRLRPLDAHRHARPRHVRHLRPAAPLRPFSAPPPSDCPAPRAHCTAAGSADPRSPQHPPLTVHPHLSAHCDPRSDSSPRFATPPAAAEIDRTGYRTGGRPRPRADQCRPPRGGRAGSLRLRPARGSSLAPSSSHTRATSPTTQRQRKARQK